ncbi:MAG: helix-turn-helix domain-containing protein [Nitrosopumilus sp.]|uniref:ArsR/SmtB family transcription factor n=1 Tax=Nitrosopumilus sp. TaxID=2024843 RepID=UPI00247B78B6|nr:winged helix-turn-helix domain-containing protein [Nitrosopumilus sp.]MCV0391733.1 helix-turn-helix domain-containing protein [Nitrosopumilus sp.]
MSSENPDDELTEKIKILATDDEKIKSFGELLTNDSSREILQLLFNEELSANQISQKTDISLQLVKYHLQKLQDLGIVKIVKVEKNSKSQDMKIYSATKFSIVIVPPKFSEKTKESKLLVRSFRHIYRVAGLGIATGLSGLFSLSLVNQDKQIVVDDLPRGIPSADESADSTMSKSLDAGTTESIAASPKMSTESESQMELRTAIESQDGNQNLEIVHGLAESDGGAMFGSDLLLPFVVITIILAGITIFYAVKLFKKSKLKN